MPNPSLFRSHNYDLVPYSISLNMEQNLNFGMLSLISKYVMPLKACIHLTCLLGHPRGTATSDDKSVNGSLFSCLPI